MGFNNSSAAITIYTRPLLSLSSITPPIITSHASIFLVITIFIFICIHNREVLSEISVSSNDVLLESSIQAMCPQSQLTLCLTIFAHVYWLYL